MTNPVSSDATQRLRFGLNVAALTCVVLSFSSPWAHADTAGDAKKPAAPLIGIIIDDLGYTPKLGARAVNLPGPVACAILPHTPHAQDLADLANEHGKEVLLHLPMQAANQEKPLGPGAIRLDTARSEFSQTLASNLSSVPHVVGVNNHMGSLVTRHPGHMMWLMEDLKSSGDMFFVDSYTHAASVALKLADEVGIPATKRDVFLDRDPSPAAVAEQFDRLKSLADKNGFAVAIGHPIEVTLSLLERELPRLYNDGYRLVKISVLIEQRQRSDL